MLAICQFCGARKTHPFHECTFCRRRPHTDEQHGEALILSGAFMESKEMELCASDLRARKPLGLPKATIDSATAAYRKLRQEEVDREAQKAAKSRRHILAFLALAISCIVIWVLSESPSVRLWYAQKRDTPQAYLKVIKRFPRTAEAEVANLRYRELTDDAAWEETKITPTFERVRKYKVNYPKGRHLAAADDTIFALAQPGWNEVQTSIMLTLILDFPKGFPEVADRFNVREALQARWDQAVADKSLYHLSLFLTLPPEWQSKWPIVDAMVKAAEPEWEKLKQARLVEPMVNFEQAYPAIKAALKTSEAIEALYNDPTWVKAQDKLEHYQRFVKRFPKHAAAPTMEKRIIDLEVAAIAKGDHGELPKAQPTGSFYGTTSKLQIQNDTDYELTVRFSGTDSKKVVIPSSQSQSLTLPNGSYQVAASVSAANVRNYYGTDEFKGGTYDSSFYIRRDSFNIPNLGLPSRNARSLR